MPFNGSGTYNPPSAPTFPAVPNTTIESADYNNVVQDLATALSNCMTRDGQSPASANIPLGGFKITGLGNGTLATDAAAFGQSMVLRGAIGAADWNNLLNTGIYEAAAASLTTPALNFPPTTDVGQLLVGAQGNVIVHIYVTANGSYTRNKVGAVWSSWSSAPVVISSNTTLNVPASYINVRAAMAFLQQRVIGAGVTVTISLAAGTINEAAEVNLNHPQGAQIVIQGAGVGVTTWSQTNGGVPLFRLSGGHSFGTISGITFASAGGAVGAITGAGTNMTSITSCAVPTGQSFTVSDGAFLAIGTGTYSPGTGATNLLVSATSGATVSFAGTVINSRVIGLGYCTFVYNNVTHAVTGRTAVDIDVGSRLLCLGSSSTIQNSNLGIDCKRGSQIIINGGLTLTVQSNTTFGVSYTDSFAAIGNLTGAGNGSGLESASLEIANGQLLSTTGDLRITPAAGANIRLDAAFTAAADAASTGYVEMKDNTGTLRRFMIRA